MIQVKSCLQYLGVSFFLSCCLNACDSYHPEPKIKTEKQQSTAHHIEQQIDSFSDENQGMPLAQVAGRAALPESIQNKNIPQPTAEELAYVGRYHVSIPCSDPFASCNPDEKETEYILNLSNNGMVYWTNTSIGRLSSYASQYTGSKIERACKYVYWYVNKNPKELVIRCDAADVSFYYNIEENGNLVFNLDRIWNAEHGRSRQFFKEYPFPKKAYVFEKIE